MHAQHLPRRARIVLTLACAVTASGVMGCVERRYTIRSDPPGALVIVNDEEIGTTPVSRSHIFYGDREITLIADGYETQTVIQPMDAPWYDNIVTEFFTENLIPFTIRDEREYMYKLKPATVAPSGDVTARANEFRQKALTPPAPRRGGILGFFGFAE
jgi:hypothetical protein